MTQYSIRLEAVRCLCKSCLLSALSSVTCLRLSDVSGRMVGWLVGV